MHATVTNLTLGEGAVVAEYQTNWWNRLLVWLIGGVVWVES